MRGVEERGVERMPSHNGKGGKLKWGSLCRRSLQVDVPPQCGWRDYAATAWKTANFWRRDPLKPAHCPNSALMWIYCVDKWIIIKKRWVGTYVHTELFNSISSLLLSVVQPLRPWRTWIRNEEIEAAWCLMFGAAIKTHSRIGCSRRELIFTLSLFFFHFRFLPDYWWHHHLSLIGF